MTVGSASGRLRVLQFLPSVESASGGPVRSTLANCRAAHAADTGLETLLISTRHRLESSWERELRGSLPDRMTMKLFSQIGRHTANVSPALLRWLWKHASRFDLLVLRALMHPLTSAVGLVARRHELPYLVVPHGTLSEWTFRHRRRLLKRLYFSLVDRGTLKGAVAVRFTSEAERADARRLDYETKGVVIPHPYEPTREPDCPGERAGSLILFLSRLDPKKGIEVLISALEIARKRDPELRLVIAGSGSESYEEKMRGIIRQKGLEEAVELPGFVTGEAKERLFRKATVFVLPSWEENFGIAAVEALDAGLPVIITEEVDVSPSVVEYGAGLVVERSPEAVADAMLKVIGDPHSAREMGERGRRLVHERFAPEVVGPQVASLYRQVTRDGRP